MAYCIERSLSIVLGRVGRVAGTKTLCNRFGGHLPHVRGLLSLVQPPKSKGKAALPLHRIVAAAIAASGSTAAVAADADDTDPFLEAPHLFPRFADVKAERVVGSMEVILAKAEQGILELEQRIERILASGHIPSFPELAHESEKLRELVTMPWSVVRHLNAVKDSQALRSAVKSVQPLVVSFQTRLSQSIPLYRAWCALRSDESTYASLSLEQRRVVELEVTGARLAGIGLEGDERQRFNAIKQELAELSTIFANNLLDATKAFARRLEHRAEVDGLPASALKMMAANARARGDTSATAEAGPWVVTLDEPCYLAVMQFSSDASLREAVYRAYMTCASGLGEGGDNELVINRILALRAESAALLGYTSHAEVSLAMKMATLESARALMEDLRKKCMGPARAEHDELERFAGKKLEHWDVAYYAEKLRAERFAYDDEEVRQYLSLDNVLPGLFGVIKRLFDVTITERQPGDLGAQVWDEGVRFFEVIRDGEPCAYLYLDPYTRPTQKRGGAWMSGFCRRSVALALPGSQVRLPCAHMVTNQSPPVTNPDGSVTPSLMTLKNVKTLFHECGHALQHVLTQVDEGRVSGISGVEFDAVEQPSQFMENWIDDVATLRGMARHWKTGEVIPDELIHKIRAARTFRAASTMLRSVKLALTDLALHDESFSPNLGRTIWDVERDVGRHAQVLPPLPEDRFLCRFRHIFASGYDAGYYSYRWAEVLSADGFAAFEEAGLGDEVAMAKLGRDYAQTVLGMGGSRPAAEVFEAFRGRPPSANALLRHKGILTAAASSL